MTKLKAQLSAELKKVQEGQVLTVVDHKHPIANIVPLESGGLFAREARERYSYRDLEPLVSVDPLEALAEERGESW